MFTKTKFYLTFIALFLCNFSEDNNVIVCERILCIFPINAKSHFLAFEPLALELIKNGHELVVVSNFPQKPPVKNLTDIDLSKYTMSKVGAVEIDGLFSIPTGTVNELKIMNLMLEDALKVPEIPEVHRLLKSKDEKFDLIITEFFDTYFYLGFAHRFKAPIIGFTFSTMMSWVNSRFGNPENPAYIPCVTSEFHSKMNFMQRLSNSLQVFTANLFHKYYLTTIADHYTSKYFGENILPLEKLAANTSVVFFNSHFSFHGSRPLVPNVIEVGGIHVRPPKKLTKDLEKFINESEHGVIYFCMGSMLKASTLPEDKRLDIVEVFSKLPQRVLWKWETETMPDKPDNVKLLKWMPQRDVLAHPNIKMFISHGGLLGTTEAVYSAVPIIGMPFYGDQGVNIEAVQAAGAGIRLDFKDLNKDSLYKAIRDILDNPKYKENAIQLSERFKDRPQTPLETAVYWTEYVIRHKGAPHLRSAAVDLTWYQYLLLDVIAFLLVSVLTILTILYYIIKQIGRFVSVLLFKSYDIKTKSKQKNQ